MPQLYHNRPDVLRVASHNVQTGAPNFAQCVRAWRRRRYDVVGLQEMHATKKKLASDLTAIAQDAGYHLLYSVCSDSPRKAGVAFLVSNDVWHGVVRSHTHTDATGRLLCVHLKWKGQNLWLVNVYVPSNDGPGARDFLQHHLAHALQHPPDARAQPVVMGDWNFVHDSALDRKHRNMVAETQNDRACCPVFPGVAPGMVDTFRTKHPSRRVYTYAGFYGVARLDRIYVRSGFMPFVTAVDVLNVCELISDHRPVVVHIAAAEGVSRRARRPGVRRLRILFWPDVQLQRSFQQWVAAQLEDAPEAAAALLLWWPTFKRQLVAKVEELNTQRKHRVLAPPALRAEYDQLAATMQAGWDALQAAVTLEEREAAIAGIHAHRRKLAATLAALKRHGEHVEPPPSWLPYNEVPSTRFTSIMAPPAESKAVHALKHPHGHLLGPGVGQANLMVQHYASISSAPAPQPAAMQQVMQAIPAHGPVGLPPPAADALGEPTVSADEVRHALKHCKPGTCPGHDGIPVELYRKAGQPMMVLLARVFTAMGETGATPANFLDGVISSIFKDGDPTLPSNYRPITLLNTDYRVLSKVLANRCLQHIPHLISPEQCAFLRGRSIGDSIMLLQLLPHQLAAEGHTGALVAFLDFRKAYDSVNRDFLREVLLAMGVGDKFVAWVMLLLSQDTRACAVVNGYKSAQVHFTAGVRQGCPLAPLLYLFVGEALLRYLKAQPLLGVTVAGGRVVAAQFADDIDPVLKGPEVVPVLVDALATYGDASNQHINVDKSKLLPVGRPSPAPVAATIAGIPVVDSASTLGIKFHAGLAPPTPKRDWEQLLSGVDSRLDKLGRLSLSAFGRAMGASAYALSRLLFYMEYAGLPSVRQLGDLQRALAKLVDRSNNNHAFTYVRKELLVGPVREGGFGLLDVQQHALARHAVLATKLLTGDATVPWIRVGRALLRHLWGPGWHPLLPLLPDAQHPHAASNHMRDAPMPAPLARIFHALHQLPAVRDVAGGLQLGPWVCNAPLVGNPWLRDSAGNVLGRGGAVAADFFGCCTVGGLAHFARYVATVPSDEWHLGRWGMVRRHYAWQQVQQWAKFVPDAWLGAALQHAPMQQPHGYSQVAPVTVQSLLGRLGWWAKQPGEIMPRPIHVHALSVRAAYRMLIQPNVDMRVARWKDFIAEACDVLPSDVHDEQIASLRLLLSTVWRCVKWSNKHKVLFWQLTVYGLPTSANRNTGVACYCDAIACECPGRKHHMWDCHAAQAVVSEVCRCLGVPTLQRRQLWLMEMPVQMMPPHVGDMAGVTRVLRQVWMVVCLAALKAMWSTAKKVMHAGHRAALASNPRGLHVLAAESAVVCFWDLLHDFCRSCTVPGDWGHTCFMNFVCHQCNRPSGLPSPAKRTQVYKGGYGTGHGGHPYINYHNRQSPVNSLTLRHRPWAAACAGSQ